MSRRLRVSTYELGFLELFVIYSKGGEWEPEWAPIHGTEVTKLLHYIPITVYNHVLHGWSKPFITALGLSPEHTLRKLPRASTGCALKLSCPMYDGKMCFPQAKSMPWCFEPNISEDKQKRELTSEIIKLWREGVYVLVVEE